MYQQRGEPERQAQLPRGLWRPSPEGEAIQFEPSTRDWYAVVDDLEADRVLVVLDRWPAVDGSGHLLFTGASVIRDFPVTELQGCVAQQRTLAGQPAADRALRVGDVFWIRSATDARRASPGTWQILDVTGPARRAARAAQLVGANPALRGPAEAPEPSAEPIVEAPRPPATGVAAPGV